MRGRSNTRTSPGHDPRRISRESVFERDRGICALCGTDTDRARRRVLCLPFARRMRELRALQARRTPMLATVRVLTERT